MKIGYRNHHYNSCFPGGRMNGDFLERKILEKKYESTFLDLSVFIVPVMKGVAMSPQMSEVDTERTNLLLDKRK